MCLPWSHCPSILKVGCAHFRESSSPSWGHFQVLVCLIAWIIWKLSSGFRQAHEGSAEKISRVQAGGPMGGWLKAQGGDLWSCTPLGPGPCLGSACELEQALGTVISVVPNQEQAAERHCISEGNTRLCRVLGCNPDSFASCLHSKREAQELSFEHRTP